jgi:hypothetical protein
LVALWVIPRVSDISFIVISFIPLISNLIKKKSIEILSFSLD